MPAGMMKGMYDEPPDDEEPMGDMGGGEEEYSPEYMAAYSEYEEAPSAATFWRAVEACVAETKSKGGGGLAILLGKPKGKK